MSAKAIDAIIAKMIENAAEVFGFSLLASFLLNIIIATMYTKSDVAANIAAAHIPGTGTALPPDATAADSAGLAPRITLRNLVEPIANGPAGLRLSR